MYQLICNFIFENDFRRLVSIPTRAESITDQIFIHDPLPISDVAVQCPLANSDHSTIICSMFFYYLNDVCNNSIDPSIGLPGGLCSPSITRYNYASADWDALLFDLSGVHWRLCFAGYLNVDDYWDTFYEILFHLRRYTCSKNYSQTMVI